MEGLKTYQCHKVVKAGKIIGIQDIDGGSKLALENKSNINMTTQWVKKHDPQVGGYLVIYDKSSYISYSPAEPFESGYTEIFNPENGAPTYVKGETIRDLEFPILKDSNPALKQDIPGDTDIDTEDLKDFVIKELRQSLINLNQFKSLKMDDELNIENLKVVILRDLARLI